MSAPSPPPDPPSTTATATAASTTATAASTTATALHSISTSPRLFSSNPQPPLPPQRPLNPLTHHHLHPTSYNPTPTFPQHVRQQQQQQTPIFTNPRIHHPQSIKPQDPHHPGGILYPVAASGRGFLAKADQNPPSTANIGSSGGGFRPRPMVSYPFPGRPYGFSYPDPHLVRPMTQLQHALFGPPSTGGSNVVKGVPISTNPKAAPSPSPISDTNGFKDQRDRSREESLMTVRDRRVKISESSTLYAQCRSWLKNGLCDNNQSQYVDCAKALPKPLPLSMVEADLQGKKENDKEEEENKEDVENLSPKELLQGHIKRAKRVRARLREERLQRIARYKGRLALLLPPVVEQQLKNDSGSGT